MTPPLFIPMQLPDHWTPEQALAALELIDLIRDHLLATFGPDILQPTVDKPAFADPRQLDLLADQNDSTS